MRGFVSTRHTDNNIYALYLSIENFVVSHFIETKKYTNLVFSVLSHDRRGLQFSDIAAKIR